MASSQNQIPASTPLCPVCHKSDQVKKIQAAYESGIESLAPPELPAGTFTMMRIIIISAALVGVGVFFILILGGTGGFVALPIPVQVVQVVITLIFIVTALVLSFVAFQRIVRGDLEAQQYYPAYDRAMENWRRLYYCSRDKVVFDAKDDKVLSEANLRNLLSFKTQPAEQVPQQSTTLSHQ